MLGLSRPALTYTVANLVSRHTRYLDNDLRTLRTLVRRGDVCVDVGAAAGVYTQALSHLVGAGGRVHSVEPVAFSHPVWSRVLGARERPNVRHHAVALGAEPGRLAMRVPFGPGGADTSRSFLDWKAHGVGSTDGYAGHAEVVVDVETLDGLRVAAGLTRLDFLKIDVEGGELHVLHGGQQTIEEFRPTMFIEIEARHTARYEYDPADIVEWLTCRGYTMYLWRDGWRATDTVCPHANNYVFRVADRPGTTRRSR
ncbi:FkbM family methyltransferase [Planosporangium sp. 12N6]|uniref:FkbM family methyltransferase n=1 Tax=Planosporangium spinosum TaxID=3402278 RepID=UPI003CE7BD2E